MTHTLNVTLKIDDNLKQALDRILEQNQQSTEELILQLLTQNLTPTTKSDTDQLRSLIGTLDLGTTDLAENHDYYIGQALYEEMHRDE